ncbi:DUF5507 domain-containing protein, partial [Escherichia coli]|nr:DUF5507 domain-containing protein [Escherichia coli]
SKSMELLAYSIIKLICKEAASGTYNGALEILQKMMSECKYHEGNAFVIMGAGEQLKRINAGNAHRHCRENRASLHR